MNQARVSKTISLYESGLLSAAEVANDLLYRLLSEPELDLSFLSSLESLPDDVTRRFVDLLGGIRDGGYHWISLRYSSDPDRSEPADYPAKLRRVCSFVEDSWTHSGAGRDTLAKQEMGT